jgi:hypothetical protein
MGLNKKDLKLLTGSLDSWSQDATENSTDAPGSFAENIVDVLTTIVNTYQYGAEEIKALLQEAFIQTVIKSRSRGKDLGKEIERETNPALRSAGACVKAARDEERKAIRTILRTVFDAESERTNPFYAFNEALKAIE